MILGLFCPRSIWLCVLFFGKTCQLFRIEGWLVKNDSQVEAVQSAIDAYITSNVAFVVLEDCHFQQMLAILWLYRAVGPLDSEKLTRFIVKRCERIVVGPL